MDLRERVARAIYLRRPDCMGKPWPFDVMTPKERRGYGHNPIAAVDLSFEYADAAIAEMRKSELPEHARSDYNRIQDPAGKIPDDEPVFLLRGQDITAPATLLVWAAMAEALGADPRIVKAARDQADEMRDWQRVCAQKLPDLEVEDGQV